MKKVYQTMHEYRKGNCLPAIIASLLELKLEDVPNFNDAENWYECLSDFLWDNEYQIVTTLYNKEDARICENGKHLDWYNENKDCDNKLKSLNDYEGINGLFCATVYSPKWWTSEKQNLHAIIIDKDFNVIHDPEKEYENIKEYPMVDELGYNGIMEVSVIQKIKST